MSRQSRKRQSRRLHKINLLPKPAFFQSNQRDMERDREETEMFGLLVTFRWLVRQVARSLYRKPGRVVRQEGFDNRIVKEKDE